MRRVLALAVVTALAVCIGPAISGADVLWGFTYTGQSIESGAAGGVLEYPEGVAVDKFGTVYVVSTNQDVINVYDSSGNLTDTWGSTGTGDGELMSPRDVDVDRWGNVYVAEQTNRRISVFNGAGFFTRHISSSGLGVDEINNPNGIAVTPDGDVYVSDSAQYVKRFSGLGTYITSWSADGRAMGIACDLDGGVWVANDKEIVPGPIYGNTVMKYSPYGVIEDSWGSTGTADGEFTQPYDVDVDGAGNVFVLEVTGDRRVQVFDSSGEFLTKYTGAATTPSDFSAPYGIGVGYQRETWVADTFNHRIVSHESVPAIPTEYAELSGATRYETAEAAAQMGWPDDSEYAIVATALNWPDALSGAGLAGACGGPLLLTNPDVLSAEVASEIERLNCDQVYVLGGTAAVSDTVFEALEAIMGPGNVSRLGGANRYETSALIADTAIALLGSSYDGTGIMVTGLNFPDALAVSPIAAANAWPVLLTGPDAIPVEISTVMADNGINHGYVIGGEAAVGGDVYDALDALWVGSPYRIEGATRYATAAAVAQLGYEGLGMYWSRAALTNGENFPDALAGGVLQGSDYGLMLLTPPNSLDPYAAAALTANSDSIYELRYLGGALAISPAVRNAAEALLH